MIVMSRIEVVAAAFLLFGGCSSSAGTARSDAGADRTESVDQSPRDGAPLGASYACAGGFTVEADGGQVAAADAGAPATCVVGQTYCGISLPHPQSVGTATAACGAVPAACTDDPTCACLCSRGGLVCMTNCHCSETNGFVTISCQAI